MLVEDPQIPRRKEAVDSLYGLFVKTLRLSEAI